MGMIPGAGGDGNGNATPAGGSVRMNGEAAREKRGSMGASSGAVAGSWSLNDGMVPVWSLISAVFTSQNLPDEGPRPGPPDPPHRHPLRAPLRQRQAQPLPRHFEPEELY